MADPAEAFKDAATGLTEALLGTVKDAGDVGVGTDNAHPVRLARATSASAAQRTMTIVSRGKGDAIIPTMLTV